MKITKKLYKVTIESWDTQLTEAEVAYLQPMFPNLRHETLDDFRESYNVRQKPEEEQEAEAVKQYTEYMKNARRRPHTGVTAIIDISTIDPLILTQLKVEAEVPVSFDADAPADTLLQILTRFESATERSVSAVRTFNKQCNVHIGGSLLMNVNDLKLCEDCCTDALQQQLDAGWRIIAACVQPDGRRPDYVLGRFNPELDEDADRRNHAKR